MLAPQIALKAHRAASPTLHLTGTFA